MKTNYENRLFLIKLVDINKLYDINVTSAKFSNNLNVGNQTDSKRGSSVNRPWDFGEVSLLILLIFGTLGNLLSIIVINRKRMRNSTASVFITSIAISDISVLFFKFLSNMIKLYRIPIFSWFVYLIYNKLENYLLNQISQNFSSIILAIFRPYRP